MQYSITRLLGQIALTQPGGGLGHCPVEKQMIVPLSAHQMGWRMAAECYGSLELKTNNRQCHQQSTIIASHLINLALFTKHLSQILVKLHDYDLLSKNVQINDRFLELSILRKWLRRLKMGKRCYWNRILVQVKCVYGIGKGSNVCMEQVCVCVCALP